MNYFDHFLPAVPLVRPSLKAASNIRTPRVLYLAVDDSCRAVNDLPFSVKYNWH